MNSLKKLAISFLVLKLLHSNLHGMNQLLEESTSKNITLRSGKLRNYSYEQFLSFLSTSYTGIIRNRSTYKHRVSPLFRLLS